MRRPRSYLLKSKFDVEIDSYITNALRELSRAEEACKGFTKTKDNAGVTRRRAQRVQEDIQRAVSLLNSLKTIYPLYDLTDKDLKD
jgi:hypothetical protein